MSRQTKSQKAKAATRLIPEEDPEFQIAPMIDILLVLLVFFMSIATDQVLQVSKDVTLPVAKDAEKIEGSRENELIVNIVWNELGGKGAIQVSDTEIELAKLASMITGRKAVNPDVKVIIRGDKNTKYEYVRSVMRVLGDAGVPNVIFSAVDKEMQK